MFSVPFTDAHLAVRRAGGAVQVRCAVRKRWVALTPEEHVRQCLLDYLIRERSYPTPLIAVERAVQAPGLGARFDVVVYDGSHHPWLLAECKAPDVPLTDAALHQLLRYQNAVQGAYWVLCNGIHTACADARDRGAVRWLDALPAYER